MKVEDLAKIVEADPLLLSKFITWLETTSDTGETIPDSERPYGAYT